LIPQRVIDRVHRYAVTIPSNGCTVSLYSKGSHGYRQIGWHEDGKRRMTLCHRVAWVAVHGEIPEGLTVDHICHNRDCIRIEHRRLLTNRENASDNGFATRTHCPVGHEYSTENTAHTGRGRKCRECSRIRDRARWGRRRDQVNARKRNKRV
jgi:hypothetical protein